MKTLPDYTGISNAEKPGLPVDQCAGWLARFAAIKRRCVEITAAHMTGTPEWELKAALGRWMWEDATQYRDLEARLLELRGSRGAIRKILDYQLGDFLTELLHAPDSLALCTGWFDVLSPAFCAALRQYLESTQPLADQPSTRILKTILAEEEERLAVGQAFLGGWERSGDSRQDWRRHFEAFLAAAGGILGDGPKHRTTPKPRAAEEFRTSRDFLRDDRFHPVIPKVIPEQLRGDDLKTMMWIRAQEMTAAEMIATVVHEWEDLPTEAIVDLARHCWDEVRHSLFGCAALEQEGIPHHTLNSWVGYAHHTLPATPPKRYSHLAIATEAGAMAYPGGKRGEWEFCRDQARHPLMTTFQDFDWADEVTHVGYGRKWLVNFFCHGNREAARRMADETVQERQEYYSRFEQEAAHKGQPFAGGY